MSLHRQYVDQVTPDKMIKLYAEDGIVITVDQAEKIIEFMYMLAEMALDILEERVKKEEKDSGSNPCKFQKDE